MTFGHNALVLSHPRATLSFDTRGALRAVPVGEGWEERCGGGVLVSMADAWRNRTVDDVAAKPVRPHDWTFSTCFNGSTDAGDGPSGRVSLPTLPPDNRRTQQVPDADDVLQARFTPSTTHAIPMQLLARQDPVADRILFYDDVPLYEDELHDHGGSELSVRVRVMPHAFFVLARLFVRVDAVLFRILDTRVFHAFGSNDVVRESTGMQAPYNSVRAYLENPEDLSPLTDANFVNATLKKIQDGVPPPRRRGGAAAPLPTARATVPGRVTANTPPTAAPTAADGAQPESQAQGKPWPGLGRFVDVLHLEDIEQGVRDLSL